MLGILKRKVVELNKQTRMQIKDFDLLEKIEKDIKALIAQEEQQSSREQVYAVSSELIDCYLLLEEEIELNLNERGGQNDNDGDGSDIMATEFCLRTGCTAMRLSNWMYNLRPSSSSSSSKLAHSDCSDLIDYQWMTESLAIMNVQLSQKIIVETEKNQQIRAKYIDFLVESTKAVESMLNNQSGDPKQDWKNDLKLCNQMNMLETMISLRSVGASDCSKKHDDLLVQIITLARELHCQNNSEIQINEAILQGLFKILETTPAAEQSETLLLIVNAIDSMPEIIENTKETSLQYKLHYLRIKLLGLLATREKEQVSVVEKDIIVLEEDIEKERNQDISGRFLLRNSTNVVNSIGKVKHNNREASWKNNHSQQSWNKSSITQDNTTFAQRSIERVLFWLIVAVKKLHLIADNPIVKQEQSQYLLNLIEQNSLEALIPTNSLSCILQELLSYGKEFYSLSLGILSRYCRVITGIKKNSGEDQDNQDLAQLADLFCVVMDAIGQHRGDMEGNEFEEPIEKCAECLKILVAAVVTSVDRTQKGICSIGVGKSQPTNSKSPQTAAARARTVQGSDKYKDVTRYSNDMQQLIGRILSRGVKMVMQVALRLSQLSSNAAFHGAEIAELLLILHNSMCSLSSTNGTGQNSNLFKLHQASITQELSCLGILCQLHAESSTNNNKQSENKNTLNRFISPQSSIQQQQKHFITNLEDTKNHGHSSTKWAFLRKILLMILKKEQIPKELFSKLIFQLMNQGSDSRLSTTTPLRDSACKKSHSNNNKFNPLSSLNTSISRSPHRNQHLSNNYEFSGTQRKQFPDNSISTPDSLHPESDSWRMLGIIALKTLLLDLGEYPQLLELYCQLIEQRFNEYLLFFLSHCMGQSSLEGSVSLSIATPIINKLALTVNNYSNSMRKEQAQMSLQANGNHSLLEAFLAELKRLFQIIDRFINANTDKPESQDTRCCAGSTQIDSIPICVLINPCELIECDALLCQMINALVEKELTVTCQLSYFRILLSALPFVISSKTDINPLSNSTTHPLRDSPVFLEKLVKLYLEDSIPDETLGYILLSAYGQHVTLLHYIYSDQNYEKVSNQYSLVQLNHIADMLQIALEKMFNRKGEDIKNRTQEDMNTLIECVPEPPAPAQESSDISKMKSNFYVFMFIRSSIVGKTSECLCLIEKCRIEFPEILNLFGQIARFNKQIQILPIIAQHYLLFLSEDQNSASFSFELLLDLIEALPEMQNAVASYPLLKSVFKRLIVDPQHMPSIQKRSLVFLLQELLDRIAVISPGSSFKGDVEGLLGQFTGK